LRQESIQIKNDRRCQQKRGYTSSLRSMLSGLTEVATSIASAVDEPGRHDQAIYKLHQADCRPRFSDVVKTA
jgi:hypothetical protein